ncbi:hypothetical protein H8959_003868 [Pygathrix nigripes]
MLVGVGLPYVRLPCSGDDKGLPGLQLTVIPRAPLSGDDGVMPPRACGLSCHLGLWWWRVCLELSFRLHQCHLHATSPSSFWKGPRPARAACCCV